MLQTRAGHQTSLARWHSCLCKKRHTGFTPCQLTSNRKDVESFGDNTEPIKLDTRMVLRRNMSSRHWHLQ